MADIADRIGNEIDVWVALTNSTDQRRRPLLVKGANYR